MICKRDAGTAKKEHFLQVAKERKTKFKLGMMEESLNMQSTDLSLITFSEEVQREMIKNGFTDSAAFCKLVLEWFQASDEPGISAECRCNMKLRYRMYLDSMVDLHSFPPPGSHVNGYTKQLWESLMARIDADLMLYSLTKRRTYNQRAVSSQTCESLFGSLATLPSSRNGVPSCVSLETDMAVLGECLVKMDPDRNFPLRLSAGTIYPQQVLESDVGILPEAQDVKKEIEDIEPKDHLFDSKHRRRCLGRKPVGLSGLYEVAKGVQGIRAYHKVNEGNVNPLVTLGLSSKSQL